MTLPILYSFRRCPYAIRARLGLMSAQVSVHLREVVLRDKPASMLEYSAKGTVPVLIVNSGTSEQSVLDESIDILSWALNAHDPEQWLRESPGLRALVERNDGEFKHWLDRYKYSIRHPDEPREVYRARAMDFIAALGRRLAEDRYLGGESLCWADAAIFPFVRQFAFVDKTWFDAHAPESCLRWLNEWLGSARFLSVMAKYPKWVSGDVPTLLPTKEA